MEPKKLYLRISAVYEWLNSLGFTNPEIDKLIDSQIIHRVYFRPGSRAYHNREQIKQALRLNHQGHTP